MFSIGLSGGIAGGKSSVSRLLAARGAHVFDADRLAHETYAPGTAGHNAIVGAFGPGVLDSEGGIDRAALGRIVFADEAARARLNAIVWPLVRARIESLQRAERAVDTAVLVIEAAVLLEAGWRDLFDEVWLVRAPAAAVRERLIERGSLSPEDAAARIAAQPDDEARLAQVDVVIDNAGDVAELEQRTEAAWALLQARIDPS